MENEIVKYYNKFNEDKRLSTRHGQVEFRTTVYYVEKLLKERNLTKILDLGAGTGKYSGYFNELRYDVTAFELVKYNLGILKKNYPNVKAIQGDARNLKKFEDDSFDAVFIFGPIYHLFTEEDKLKVILEAKRVLRKNGLIFISYCMNDYAVLLHGFIDQNINETIRNGKLDENFKVKNTEDDIFSFDTLKDVKRYSKKAGLKRVDMIAQDSATDYIRPTLNKMDNETFELFFKWHLKNSNRKDLIGASSHVLDILTKE